MCCFEFSQNRKDAIRNAIQLQGTITTDISRSKRADLFGGRGRRGRGEDESLVDDDTGARRLTRAAFSRTLQKHTERRSVFNVRGLHRLQETFHALDRSIGSGASSYHGIQGIGNTEVSDCRPCV